MKTSFWIVVAGTLRRCGYKDGEPDYYVQHSSIIARKNKPPVGPHEVAIKIDLDLPDALFVKPSLKAEITVPKDQITTPVIEAAVADNIGEVLSEKLGIEVKVSAEPPTRIEGQ